MTTAWPAETTDASPVAPESAAARASTISALAAHTRRGSDHPGSAGGRSEHAPRPRTIALRSFTATTLLIVGLLAAGLVGYGTGLAGYRMPSHVSARGTASMSADEPTPPKKRACETFAGAYRSLPDQLRAAQLNQPHMLIPAAAPKLAAAASSLAELLRVDLGLEYGFRPWPVWLQTLDNYVGALRAVAFVVSQPDAREPLRVAIGELYQQALTPVLALCYVAQ